MEKSLMGKLNRKPKSKSYIKCEHGIYEENCVKCFPEMLCEHDTRRNRCVKCNPRLLCPHDKSKYRCKLCAKPRYKRVENKDAFKKLPKGCDHCNNKANCYVCTYLYKTEVSEIPENNTIDPMLFLNNIDE